MTSVTPFQSSITMTSRELVDFINSHRKEQAEAAGVEFPSAGFAKLEHADFLKKVPEVVGEVAGNFSGYYTASNDHCRGVAKRYPILDSLGRTQGAHALSRHTA